ATHDTPASGVDLGVCAVRARGALAAPPGDASLHVPVPAPHDCAGDAGGRARQADEPAWPALVAAVVPEASPAPGAGVVARDGESVGVGAGPARGCFCLDHRSVLGRRRLVNRLAVVGQGDELSLVGGGVYLDQLDCALEMAMRLAQLVIHEHLVVGFYGSDRQRDP